MKLIFSHITDQLVMALQTMINACETEHPCQSDVRVFFSLKDNLFHRLFFFLVFFSCEIFVSRADPLGGDD
jgi:hypothetical protein